MTFMERLTGLLGLMFFIGIAVLLSTNRKKISWKLVAWGLGMQFFFAVLILPESFFNTFIKSVFDLEMAPGAWFFDKLNTGVAGLLQFTTAGTEFLVGSQTLGAVGEGFHNFIFDVLPTILFFSALMAIFYHLGIIQVVVSVIAKAMAKTMGTSGAESLSAAANIFIGQTEAPLVIKPYIEKMTRSELLAIMTGGMSTVAGGLMAAYVALLSDAIPDIAGHLIAASVMSAPAALVIAKILIPEDETPQTMGNVKLDVPKTSSNAIDAAAQGATDGLSLAMNVGAMLLVFIAILALLNAPVQWLGDLVGFPELSIEYILGLIMSPLAWLMGVPAQDITEIGSLLGLKTTINEFVAFSELSDMVNTPEFISGNGLDYRSVVIATYALTGFSNFSSIAIQIGGIGSLAPSRKQDLARLGIKALIAGSFACFMTASIAGVLTPNKTGPVTLLASNKTEAIEETGKIPLNKSFHRLKTDLTGNMLPMLKQKLYQNARNRMITWQGRFYSYDATTSTLRLYFGIKPVEQITGNELHSFAVFKLTEVPQKLEILRPDGLSIKEFSKLNADDPVKITGILKDFEISPANLFSIEHSKILNGVKD